MSKATNNTVFATAAELKAQAEDLRVEARSGKFLENILAYRKFFAVRIFLNSEKETLKMGKNEIRGVSFEKADAIVLAVRILKAEFFKVPHRNKMFRAKIYEVQYVHCDNVQDKLLKNEQIDLNDIMYSDQNFLDCSVQKSRSRVVDSFHIYRNQSAKNLEIAS